MHQAAWPAAAYVEFDLEARRKGQLITHVQKCIQVAIRNTAQKRECDVKIPGWRRSTLLGAGLICFQERYDAGWAREPKEQSFRHQVALTVGGALPSMPPQRRFSQLLAGRRRDPKYR